MRRFAPLTVVFLSYAAYKAFSLETLASVTWQALINVSAFALCTLFAVRAVALFPNERHWIRRIERAIDCMDWRYAEFELATPPGLLGFRGQFLQKLMRAKLAFAQRQYEKALEQLMKLANSALTAEERFGLRLQLASLYLETGNVRAFGAELEALDKLPESIKQQDALGFGLLQARLLELESSFNEAKGKTESCFSLCKSGMDQAVCYVNLGRLEDLRLNEQMALSYFEQAWVELKKDPIPRYFCIIGHNLLLKYGRIGEIAKAKALLQEYWELVQNEAPDLVLEFYNDQTHLARQIGDRALLIKSYESIADIKGFDEKSRYCIAAHELRMLLGDDFYFIPTFRFVFERFPTMDLAPEERFSALEQLRVVWQQGKAYFPEKIWHSCGHSIDSAYLENEHIIDERLRTVSPSLPAIREVWLKRKLEVLRMKVQMHRADLKPESFDSLFSLMAERCRLWSDCNNTNQAIQNRIVYVDDYLAYVRQIGSEFLGKFRPAVLSMLSEAEYLLDETWPTPAADQALGIAYLSWKLKNDTEKRNKWVARFESRQLSMDHFLPWLREQYQEMKADSIEAV